MKCQFTWKEDLGAGIDNGPERVCGQKGWQQQLDGEWRCIHHVNLGYHNHHGVREKPVDCGHPLHCKKCCRC